MNSNNEQNYISMVVVINKKSVHIRTFFEFACKFSAEHFNHYEFVIVNNNAAQTILTELEALLTNTNLQANLITLPYEVNKEQAVLAGIEAAIGDYIFEFENTDIDYTSDNLWKIYQACLAGNDIVMLKPNSSISFFKKLFYTLLAKYSNQHNTLFQSTVHLISRRAINRVLSLNKLLHYRKYAYCNSGLNYQFIEYDSTLKNHISLSLESIDHATDLLLIFTRIGKKISLFFSFIFALFSLFFSVYAICAYIILNVVQGWTTTMLLLSISFTGVFLCFSIVIKYLSLLLENQRYDESLIASKKKI